jgi:hypothetical protein
MLTRTVGYFAWLLFALALLVTVKTILRPKPKPEGVNAQMPALAMEFVKSDEELPTIIGRTGDSGTDEWRAGLLSDLKFDYVFIVIYWLLYVGIAAVLAQSGGRRGVWLAVAATLCATAAAACDVVENLHMAKVINAARMVENVATPGFFKWLFIFITVALLSTTFFGRGSWVWVAGVVCLLIAGLGLAGLVSIKLGSRNLSLVGAAFVTMLLVLLPLVAYAFTVKTELFTRSVGSS